VFGDSLSDVHAQRSEAYPALLAKKLRAVGLNFEVINASASGVPPAAVWNDCRRI